MKQLKEHEVDEWRTDLVFLTTNNHIGCACVSHRNLRYWWKQSDSCGLGYLLSLIGALPSQCFSSLKKNPVCYDWFIIDVNCVIMEAIRFWGFVVCCLRSQTYYVQGTYLTIAFLLKHHFTRSRQPKRWDETCAIFKRFSIWPFNASLRQEQSLK